MEDIKRIGNLVRELRGDMSLREFAQKCQVSHTTIDNIEKGWDFRTKKPVQVKLGTLEKISAACGVPMSYFMEKKYIIGEKINRTIAHNIRHHRERAGLTVAQLADKLGVSDSTVQHLESGEARVESNMLAALCQALGVTEEQISPTDEEDVPAPKPNAIFLDSKKIHLIPVYETVSAGFGSIADDNIVDYTPLYFSDPGEADESICIKVKGDSMYPKIEDGDIIQVHRQDFADNGALAVVLVDGEEALVKRIEYGRDRLELHSINPMYPPRRFTGSNVELVRILGVVRKIIKSV